MVDKDLDEHQKAEQERLARETARMAGRKSARDMTDAEWKKAKANIAVPKATPRKLPDAKTLSDAEFRRALGKINLAG